ncbi:hypothetical protein [Actinomycetospora cinnamomea]|uniref:hypothetical protein n=1 Tax=Actinomycetospora cinnamomea TaxID=663609 RepID=UPI00105830F3|nr:hypothetical protein [Actinomycetospora cinnamomea]
MTGERWVARLDAAGGDVAGLLAHAGGLDVWERHDESIVVAADEDHLAELERRGLARVERLEPVTEFLDRHQGETR